MREGLLCMNERRRITIAISQPVQKVLEKLRNGKELSSRDLNLLLTPAEVAEVLTWKKGQPVSPRYIPQLLRDGRLEADSMAGGNSYLYKLRKVLEVEFKPAGRPPGSGNQKT